MNKSIKRLGAGAAVGALALAGVAVAALPASATPTKLTSNTVFELLDGSDHAITTGSTTSTSIQGIHIDSICPGPYAADSVALFGLYDSTGTFVGSPAQSTQISDDGVVGVNGLKSTDTQILENQANGGGPAYVALESLAAGAADNSKTLTNGAYELRWTCYTTAGGLNSPTADDSPYFGLPITITGTTFTVTGVTPPKPATTTTLSATVASGSPSVATFTSTVTKASGSATPTGTVAVTNGGTPLCTITLPATTCTANVANGSYSAIGTYSGDTNFQGSVSPAYQFTVGAIGAVSGQITVVVPDGGNTGLTLTGTPSATINAAHTTDNRFTGSANFANVTVTDGRQIGAPTWHLAGVLTTLARNGGNGSIPASDVGWTPGIVTGAGAANAAAGPVVKPTHQGGPGLLASQPLASGDVPTSTANLTTNVFAALNLDTDGNKPAGTYLGTLTITLTAP